MIAILPHNTLSWTQVVILTRFKTMTVIRYDINIFVRGTRSGRLSQKCWADPFFICVNDVDYELAIKVGKF